MIEKMSESEGKMLGFRVMGTVTKADYTVLVPEIQSLIDEEGSISLLLDLTQFKWEDIEAWGADINFGRTYHEKIDKIAIVGDKSWERWIAILADPFYSNEASFLYFCSHSTTTCHIITQNFKKILWFRNAIKIEDFDVYETESFVTAKNEVFRVHRKS